MADNVDVIEKLWEAFMAGDADRVAARFAPDGEIVFPESVPWGGTHQGPDGVSDAMLLLRGSFDEFSARPEMILGSDDDHVTVIVQVSARGKGGRFEGAICWLYKLRDGKVARAQAFPDTAAIREAIGKA
jgi:ketosteroid isomerase-like protein